MGAKYIGTRGTIYEVEDEYIAKGGEGVLYGIKDDDKVVAKIFKEKCRTPERENKLAVMVKHHLNDNQLAQITWPQDILYENQKFVGYIMPKLNNTMNLNGVYSRNMKAIGLKERVTIAHNICVAVAEIHKIGQVCGDLNPQNICVNLDVNSPNPYHVTLVDTDSYHITSGDTTYRCGVGLSSYIAPELQKRLTNGMNLETLTLPTFTKETDLFALAVHIFNLLMGGCHPFACAKKIENSYENSMEAMKGEDTESVALPQPDENIKEGFFPFYHQRQGITYPLYAPSFESLPYEIRQLFIKTFETGYIEPGERTTADEWKSILRKYASTKLIFECDKGHKYFNHLSNCPYCETTCRAKRLLSSLQFDSAHEHLKSELSEDGNNSTPQQKQLSNVTDSLGSKDETTRYYIWALVIAGVIVALLMLFDNASGETDDYGQEYNQEYDYIGEERETIKSEGVEATTYIKVVETEQITTLSAEEIRQQKEDKIRLEIGKKLYKSAKNGKYKQAAEQAFTFLLSNDLLDETKTIYMYQNKLVDKIKDGKGLIFDVDDNWVYYGEIKNGKASGKGTEMASWGNGYYTLKGKFKKGYANGKCVLFNSALQFSDGTKYKSTITGTFKNGWENGSMSEKIEYLSDDRDETYYWKAEMGKRKMLEYEDDVGYIYAETADGGWRLYYEDKSNLEGHGTPRKKGK